MLDALCSSYFISQQLCGIKFIVIILLVKNRATGADAVTLHINPLLAAQASHMDAGSSPGCCTSNAALCQWPGETAEEGQGFGPLYPHDRSKRSSFLPVLDWLSCDHCSCLQSKAADGRFLSLSLPLFS